MQRKRGLEIGRPLGFPLLVHRSWLPAGALVVAHLVVTAYGGEDLLFAVGLAVATLIAFFMSVVVHELAHSIVSRLLGIRIADTVLYVFGGVSRVAVEPVLPAREIVAALTGPIVSAALGAVAVVGVPDGTGSIASFVRTVGYANLALAATNALPALPLDGGRVMAAIVWTRTGRRSRGVRRAARLGQILGLVSIGVGVWLILGSGVLDDTAIASWLVVTGIFIATTATKMVGSAKLIASIENETAASWAKPFVGRIKADAVVPPKGGPFAVADEGRLAGILLPSTTATRAGASVRDVMVPWTNGISVRGTEPLERALEQLARQPGHVLVVLDEEGVVRGVLDDHSVRSNLVDQR
ncbi:MAG: site-2 protease family protein [Actinomycetota bacterium]